MHPFLEQNRSYQVSLRIIECELTILNCQPSIVPGILCYFLMKLFLRKVIQDLTSKSQLLIKIIVDITNATVPFARLSKVRSNKLEEFKANSEILHDY